ncbi:MAG: flavin reductase family protein [Bacteroidales bacterium]|nr:flavin reductase family protein [Bacteroidales bacterium]
MKKSDISVLGKENAFDLISKQWMLVTAGNADCFNTMTASWGGVGFIWNKHVAFLFIRPERYTHDFIEKNERLTLSFFSEEFRPALQICGSKSGRDTDKVKESGLTPVATESGSITFEQARMTLDCRKLFRVDMQNESFVDKSLLERWYNSNPGGGLHSVYIVEIENVYE